MSSLLVLGVTSVWASSGSKPEAGSLGGFDKAIRVVHEQSYNQQPDLQVLLGEPQFTNDALIYTRGESFYRLSKATNEPELLFQQPGFWGSYTVSSDGKLFVLTLGTRGNELKLLIKRHVQGTGENKEDSSWSSEILKLSGSNHDPALSPDGKHLVFVSAQKGREELHVLKMDSPLSSQRAISSQSLKIGTPVWSPNGKRLAWRAMRKGRKDLADIFVADWTLNQNKFSLSNPLNLSVEYSGLNLTPAWSGDGQWLVFSSNRNSSGLQELQGYSFEKRCFKALNLNGVDGVSLFPALDRNTEKMAWTQHNREKKVQILLTLFKAPNVECPSIKN